MDETRLITPADDVTLSDFMSRPILIDTAQWTPGVTPFTRILNPWNLFFNNKRNINRVNNFNIMNAILHVKIMVNGNPFYFGRLMADYAPLSAYDKVTQFNTLDPTSLIGASQRMHAFLNPTTSQGAHFELPFIWPENGVNITTAEWGNLGTMYLREINVLKHANGSATPVTINIFAWATDVRLSIPTSVNSSALVTQASEVDMKPSTIASSIASAAGSLSRVPFIGRYAMATSMVAGALGKVAKMFGFSRPIVAEPAALMRPSYCSELATTDKKEAIFKLSADSRQELTIDPAVFGVSVPDELAISYIASKETYLVSFPWTVAGTAGSHLWNIRVSPSVCILNTNYYLPAMCFASQPFAYWRGTLRYRFQIVCSAYHKGRLLFIFDPNFVNAVETNTTYTRIIDLEDETDFVMDVSWASSRAFLPVTPFTSAAGYQSTTKFTTTDSSCNGVLGVYVLNSLTTPNSTINNDISINVFVSACDDIDFSVPESTNISSIAYVTQSEEVNMENIPIKPDSDDCVADCLPDDHTSQVFFGEKFISFRNLLRRYVYHSSALAPVTTISRFTWTNSDSDFPRMRGIAAVNGSNNAGLANYCVTTLLNYLAPAFLCERGSIRHKVVVHQDSQPYDSLTTVVRGTGSSGSFSNTVNNVNIASYDAFMKYSTLASNFTTASYKGSAMTVNSRQPIIEYEIPYYNTYRFSVAKDPYGTNVTSSGYSLLKNSHSVCTTTSLTATTDRTYFDRYVSVGEDFQLVLFQGCPPVYVYTIP